MNAISRDPFAPVPGLIATMTFLAVAASRSIVPTCLRTRTTPTCASERPAFSPRATWDSARLSARATYRTARPRLQSPIGCRHFDVHRHLVSIAGRIGDRYRNFRLVHRFLNG